jgi:hypothetical protein
MHEQCYWTNSTQLLFSRELLLKNATNDDGSDHEGQERDQPGDQMDQWD